MRGGVEAGVFRFRSMKQPSKRPLRLAIAGIHIESSTFSPLPSRLEDFHATRGAEMLARYPFLETSYAGRIDPVPLAHFRALPGGPVRRADYEEMKREILERLALAGPVDALWFDVHGAMSVDGLEDAEADLLAALKAALPEGTPVTCCQDLHGNVSARLVSGLDLITAYRTAPHVDWMETRERAVALLLRWAEEGRPLYRSHVRIPVLVSGEMSSTLAEPGASLYAGLARASERPGVWDASLWVGYAWADQARAAASVVVCGSEPAAVEQTARELAWRYWQARRDFAFGSPAGGMAECVDAALALERRPVFLSDAGDNPTAGAAGDVPGALADLLAHPEIASGRVRAVFASIPDAAAVACCVAAGEGAEVDVEIGGKLDPVHGRPLWIRRGRVERVVAAGGDRGACQVVLRSAGCRILLTEQRKPFHLREDFLRLGIEPLDMDLVVVKIGYLEPELRAMAAAHFLVLSEGAVPPRLDAVPYRSVVRPSYPLEDDFVWEPELRTWRSGVPVCFREGAAP